MFMLLSFQISVTFVTDIYQLRFRYLLFTNKIL